jgi:DNA-binding NarL/FixJ family response regulator
MAAILSRDRRFQICGGAHSFSDAHELIRHERPDILLIEPFLENRDGLRWIKDLVTEFPSTRILIVSRQSESVYAERALHAGAAGYWMENGSRRELLLAVETVARKVKFTSVPLLLRLRCENWLVAAQFRIGSTSLAIVS